jgi:hypothetical protein
MGFKNKLNLSRNKKYKIIWNGSNGYVIRKQKDFKWLLEILKMDFPGLKMPDLKTKDAKTLKVFWVIEGIHHKLDPEPRYCQVQYTLSVCQSR